jgi:hypothetical protein
MEIVYVVVFYRNPESEVYEIVGVYSTPEKANANCVDDRYGYGPLTVNETAPYDRTTWPGFTFPKQETQLNQRHVT